MKSILLTVGIWLAISPLTAQSNPAWPPVMPFGVVKGFVRDAYSNQPLPYANILIMGTTSGTMAQKDGSYAILFVPPGTYTVRAMMMAYNAVIHSRIVVRMGGETDLSISLEEKWPSIKLEERSIVGTETFTTTADIRCDIVAPVDTFHVGEAPTFRVIMSNLGSESFFLVPALDGSFDGIRYPTMSMTIEGPGRQSKSGGARCGNVSPIEPEDFVAVLPNGTFEPFDVYLSNEPFAQPGEYKVTFSYSTYAIDYKFWVDRLGPVTIDPRAHELLKHVPRVRLEKSITVEVVQ